MSRETQNGRVLAARIVALETRGDSADVTSPPVYIAIGKLSPHLSTLMGKAGFRALLGRALALASADSGWLRAVRVNPDGTLDDPLDVASQIGPEEIAEGRVALFSRLLELMITFIGEHLTVRLLREVWGELRVDDLDSVNQGKRENTTGSAGAETAQWSRAQTGQSRDA